jgi:hypothetical protein
VLSLSLAAPARANIGAPDFPGDPAAEASGDFAALEILSEELRFDLRPLAVREPVQVKVRYRIRSRSAEPRTMTMAFITPGVEQGSVELDGKRLAHRELPASQPASQPAGRSRVRSPEKQLVFAVTVAARGEHRIDVAYQMRPSGDTLGSLYWKHGILYDLSPARQWASFGTLDVEALAPPGWEVQSDPLLEREGDRLHRRFKGLPAANLVLSASRPAEYTWGWLLIVLGGLGGAVGGIVFSRRRGKRSVGSAVPALLAGLGYGLLGAAIPLLLAAGGLWLWRALLDTHQSSGRELYSVTLALLFLGVPSAVVLFVVNAATYVITRRRTMTEP